jgi:hypothetical protein
VAPTQIPAGIKIHSTVLRPSTYVSQVSGFAADGANPEIGSLILQFLTF